MTIRIVAVKDDPAIADAFTLILTGEACRVNCFSNASKNLIGLVRFT